jgi:hypothetical protein
VIVNLVPPLSDWSQEDRDMLSNGCGPEFQRWFPWTWIPIPDLAFREACNEHDREYRIGGIVDMSDGDSSAREVADRNFLQRMLNIAYRQPWYWSWLYIQAAHTFHAAVSSDLGRVAFVYREWGEVVTLQTLRDEELGRRADGEAPASACWRCRRDAT